MSTEIEKALWADYKEASVMVENLSTGEGDEKYKILFDEKEKVRSGLIKLKQFEHEKEMQDIQTKHESKWKWIGIGVTFATIFIDLINTKARLKEVLDFDREHTFTSTVGRNIASSSILSGLFKRK